jgi:MEMO1 family protein
MKRKTVVEGSFYEASPVLLRKHIDEMTGREIQKSDVFGMIAPHAGYMYSGKTAAMTYAAVNIPKTVIIMGPNHTGLGEPIAVYTNGEWETPFGPIGVNEKLAREILKNCSFASQDTEAHLREHSIEVHLPFLLYHRKDIDFVPICIGDTDLEHLRSLAAAIAASVKDRDILIIASTDLTHYEEAKEARRKDSIVMESIEKLDPEKMRKDVSEMNITMCGWAPVYTMLHACIKLGATKGKIIKYMNSGDASGDYSEVVGYTGAVII